MNDSDVDYRGLHRHGRSAGLDHDEAAAIDDLAAAVFKVGEPRETVQPQAEPNDAAVDRLADLYFPESRLGVNYP